MGCQAEGSANLTTVMIEYRTKITKCYDAIKLGIDADAKWYYVTWQLDGFTPQPGQKMTFEALLHCVAKHQGLAGLDQSVGVLADGGRSDLRALHRERNHQGLENRIIDPDFGSDGEGEVQCSERLGGLLRYYYRDGA